MLEFFSKKIQKPNFIMQSGPCELRIEVCYCIFGVYFVTGTKNPDISKEGTFRISIFFITTKMAKPDFWYHFIGLTLSPRQHGSAV
jgi:hypothetical protein